MIEIELAGETVTVKRQITILLGSLIILTIAVAPNNLYSKGIWNLIKDKVIKTPVFLWRVVEFPKNNIALKSPTRLVKMAEASQVANELKTPPSPRNAPIIAHTLKVLSKCESNNNPNIVIVDTNGKKSYGKYMFQLQTFYNFGKKYKLIPHDASLKDAENMILDPLLQEQIATKMLKDGLWYHWKNCLKDIYA